MRANQQQKTFALLRLPGGAARTAMAVAISGPIPDAENHRSPCVFSAFTSSMLVFGLRAAQLLPRNYRVVLLPLEEGHDLAKWNEPHLMGQLADLVGLVMGARTGFPSNEVRRHQANDCKHLITSQLFAQHRLSRDISAASVCAYGNHWNQVPLAPGRRLLAIHARITDLGLHV